MQLFNPPDEFPFLLHAFLYSYAGSIGPSKREFPQVLHSKRPPISFLTRSATLEKCDDRDEEARAEAYLETPYQARKK